MKIKIVVHDAEEGGYWAEVPAILGCASQGETMNDLMINLREAIEGCLSVEVEAPTPGGDIQTLELTISHRYPAAPLLVWSSGAAEFFCASMAAIISMASRKVWFDFRSPSMATAR